MQAVSRDRRASKIEINSLRNAWLLSGVRMGDLAAAFGMSQGYLSNLLLGLGPKGRLKLSDLRRLRELIEELRSK